MQSLLLGGLIALTISGAEVARGGAIVTLDPGNGVATGTPGGDVTWGFTFANGSSWISIDSVTLANETSPLGGSGGGFTDYIAGLGGLSNGVTAPGQTWIVPTGVDQYAIDPGTAPGVSDSGTFTITYDQFSADPNTCGSCYVGTLRMYESGGKTPSFTIDVKASPAVPEPGTLWLLASGALLVAGIARRRRRLFGGTIPLNRCDTAGRTGFSQHHHAIAGAMARWRFGGSCTPHRSGLR